MGREEVRSATDRGDVSLARGGDSHVVIRLSGSWRLATGVPSADDLAAELTRSAAREVTFDAGGLGEWDSALIAFLERLAEICSERDVRMDRDRLPAGVQRLLRLAEAVPEQPGVRRGPSREPWLGRFGRRATAIANGGREDLAFLGDATLSFGRLATGRARFRGRDLLLLIQGCGASALPIVTLISVLVGMIFAFVGAVQLSRFGAQIYVADLVAIAIVREMGAIMTGIIMAGRTGSGFAAELGTMKVTQEIDALSTLGLSAVDFLVLPRILALSLMMPLLTIYSDVLGIVGGGVVGTGLLDFTMRQYAHEAHEALTLTNCVIGVGKSFVFGLLVAVAGCARGMQCGKSSSAVGDAATSAVVTGIVLIIVADGLFAVIFNVLGI
jgi:phospholipid/cholesterol/gamma-HCH transport system permease protein